MSEVFQHNVFTRLVLQLSIQESLWCEVGAVDYMEGHRLFIYKDREIITGLVFCEVTAKQWWLFLHNSTLFSMSCSKQSLYN